MKLKRAVGLQLFAMLGFKTAAGWSNERLIAKLKALPLYIKDKDKKSVKSKSPELSKVLESVLSAASAEEDFTVTEKEEKVGKPKTKQPVPDDDDEEGDETVELQEGDTVVHAKYGTCEVIAIDGDTLKLKDENGKRWKGVDPDEVEKVEPEEEDEEETDDEDQEEDAEDAEDEDSGDEEEEEESEDDESDEDSDDEEDSGEEEESDEDADEDEEESEDSEDEEDEDETEDDEEDEDMADEAPVAAPKKKGTDKGGKKAPPAKGKGDASNFKKAGGEGKPGVIATIKEVLLTGTKEKPVTKAKILDVLVKRFGKERSEDAMKQTLNIQLPTRLKAAGLNIQKDERGYWVAGGKPKPAAPAPAKGGDKKAPAKKK